MSQVKKAGKKGHKTTNWFAAVVLVLVATDCFGWNSIGHAEFSKKVYQSLSSLHQSRYSMLANRLKKEFYSSKKYGYLKSGYFKANCSNKPALCFLGLWPDSVKNSTYKTLIKNAGGKTTTGFISVTSMETGSWHFQNTYMLAETSLTANDSVGCSENGRAEQAFKYLLDDYRINDGFLLRQAIDYALLVHIAADVHQPLHAFSRLKYGNRRMNCAHDAGGNGVCLESKNADCVMSLHQFWDSAGGVFKEIKHWQSSVGFLKEVGVGEHLFNIRLWLGESAQYANQVYSFNHVSWKNYESKVRSISMDRIDLAVARISALTRYLFSRGKHE